MEYPTRKLQVYSEPTVFNKEMAIGMLTLGPIGAIVGGLIGTTRMNSEKQYGKTLGEPSMMNKDTFLGAAIGYALAGSALLVGGMTAGLPAVVLAITLPALGGFIGGSIGKQKMQNEYDYSFLQEKNLAANGHAPAQAVTVPEIAHEPEQSKYRDMVAAEQQQQHHR